MLKVGKQYTSVPGKSVMSSVERDDLSGSPVFIVEDTPLNHRQTRHCLAKTGFQVFETKSSEEVIYPEGEIDPVLIVMDVMMEGASGFIACERVRVKKPGIPGHPRHFPDRTHELRFRRS